MIKSITIQKGERGIFTNKLYIRKGKPRIFEFTNGLNIITGRNGSGKTVLLNIIKNNCGIFDDTTSPYMVHPSHLTKSFFDDEYYTIDEYIKETFRRKDYPLSTIEWDGSMVHYITPEWFNPTNVWDRLDSPYRNIYGNNEIYSFGDVLKKMVSNFSAGENLIELINRILSLPKEYNLPENIQTNDV